VAYPDEILADAPKYWYRLAAIGAGVDISAGSTRDVATPANSPASGWRGICTDGFALACWNNNQGATLPGTTLYVQPGYTIELWFWPALTPPSRKTLWNQIGAGNVGNSIDYESTGKLTVNNWNGAALIATSSVATLNVAAWNHVVLSLAAGDFRLYINGVLDKAFNTTQSPSSPAQSLRLFNTNGLNQGPSGLFAEVAIYPSILSAGRVLAHYNAANLKAFDPVYVAAVQAGQITQVSTDTTALLASTTAILNAVRKTY